MIKDKCSYKYIIIVHNIQFMLSWLPGNYINGALSTHQGTMSAFLLMARLVLVNHIQ